ncbi:hypothetical protein B5K06_30415 [Rhizobium grahamii]|uniref:Uncharacterized protein n=3 Tax=Rhizobium grahamii TaxID=1120045 RepID=S3IBA7_9HYPH|nr:hypothetical protein RGCCGE502_20260 [Rhizobium grahamii CCGE 502]RDJ03311.1 hypothetical protein B5K06_30415 [Rhizobium grahamii]
MIHDWLEDKLEHMEREGFEVDTGAFEQQADMLRAEAQAEGYEASDLEGLCNGDIAAYLRDRRDGIARASLSGNILPDDV